MFYLSVISEKYRVNSYCLGVIISVKFPFRFYFCAYLFFITLPMYLRSF